MLEVVTETDSSYPASGFSFGVSLEHFSESVDVWRAEQVVVEVSQCEVGNGVVIK